MQAILKSCQNLIEWITWQRVFSGISESSNSNCSSSTSFPISEFRSHIFHRNSTEAKNIWLSNSFLSQNFFTFTLNYTFTLTILRNKSWFVFGSWTYTMWHCKNSLIYGMTRDPTKRLPRYETYNLWPLLLPFWVGGVGVWSDRPPSRLLVPHPSTLLPLWKITICLSPIFWGACIFSRDHCHWYHLIADDWFMVSQH